jgi:hypothetical protein
LRRRPAQGFFRHPVIAVDAEDEAVLAVIDAAICTRAAAPVDPRTQRGIEANKSLRRITGTRQRRAWAGPPGARS